MVFVRKCFFDGNVFLIFFVSIGGLYGFLL